MRVCSGFYLGKESKSDSCLQSRFALDLYLSIETILYLYTELCFTRFISEQRTEIWPLVQVINTLYNCISVKFSCNSQCWTHLGWMEIVSMWHSSHAPYSKTLWQSISTLEYFVSHMNWKNKTKKKMLDFQHNVALLWKNVATTITTFQPIG